MILAAHSGTRMLLLIVALLSLAAALLAPIGSAFLRPVSAGQPLCLGETIWDEEQQQCVPIDGTSPAPMPSAPAEPVTPSPAPSAAQPSPEPAETPTITPGEPSADPSAMPDDESPLPPDAALDLAAVSLYSTVYACREGVNWYSLADASPFRPNTVPLCTETVPGLIPFNVRSGDRLIAMANATNPLSDGGMYAVLQPLPSGDITIVSTPPLGYGTPIVYCSIWRHSTADTPGGQSRASQRYFATIDGEITIPAVSGGEGIACQWNIVPTDASAEIQMRGYQCPVGLGIDTDPEIMLVVCPYLQDEREFMILGPEGVDHQFANPAGNVTYERLVPGTYQITGFQPDDFLPPLAICELIGPDGQTLRQWERQIPSGADSISYSLNTLETLRCDWFFIPALNVAIPDVPRDLCAGASPTPEASRTGLGITIGRDIVCRQEGERGG